MIVERIHDDTGSHIEPPLDPEWTELDKLRWWAAAVSLSAGFEIEVRVATYKIDGWPQAGYYNVARRTARGYSCCGPYDASQCWTFLAGVDWGADE